MDIYWSDESERDIEKGLRDTLERVIHTGLARAGKADGGELSVSFVTRAEIRRLNAAYRGLDKETDVLSFDGLPPCLGDIALCAEVARAQAEAYGHSYEREAAFLTAHGLLHLLGYDHADEAGEEVMCREQEAILSALGITR